MKMEFTKSFKYIESALNTRALRSDLISSNLANVDTPYFRSKDVDFEGKLAKRAHQEYFGKYLKNELELAKTNTKHIDPKNKNLEVKPTLFYRDGHMARNDGNTVDIDVENTEMAKNTIMYNALMTALKRSATGVKAAIESSKNL